MICDQGFYGSTARNRRLGSLAPMVILEHSASLPWAAERPDVDEFYGEHRPEWMARALCRGQATNIWFPGQGGDLETPKAACEQCPVLVECLAYALERPELCGVWGGTGERQRVRMRRARNDDGCARLAT
jgi:WhiB family redox-sensing transcriptional regulator